MSTSSRLWSSLASLALSSAMLVSPDATAQDDGAAKEAAKHFQRGVALYGETDYRAALVEFKRAYATSPNVAVLFNVGEAEYQLQDYANALATFGRYLTQTSVSDSRRGEVESTVEVLRARVGRLTVTTSPPGADVTIDDQPVGKTPLEDAVLVSVGHRKVMASMPGRPSVTRYVDVAAEDSVPVSLILPAPPDQPAVAPAPARALSPIDPGAPSHNATGWRTAGWIATGTFAAGALGFGALVLKSSNDLNTARETYPTTSATLSKDATLVKTYSMIADSLTAAAVVVGGITLYATLTSSAAQPRRDSATARVWLGPASAHFDMTF